MEEGLLIEKIINGEKERFTELVNKYKLTVYRIAYRMLGNQQDAEDMTQEIFLKIYNKLPEFGRRAKFSTWLYRIAVNKCLDELKGRKYNNELLADNLLDSKEPTPEELLLNKETNLRIKDAFKVLTYEEQMILTLRLTEELSFKQIAEILNIAENNARVRFLRARKQLGFNFERGEGYGM